MVKDAKLKLMKNYIEIIQLNSNVEDSSFSISKNIT